MCIFPLNDMVMIVEKVSMSIHIYRLYLRLECQLTWFFDRLVRGHSFIDRHRLQLRRPLRHLGGPHVVLLHVLVHLHQVLLALSSVGLAGSHSELHQFVRVVHEIELVLVWRDIIVVVVDSTV
jgi:hypothetical protein